MSGGQVWGGRETGLSCTKYILLAQRSLQVLGQGRRRKIGARQRELRGVRLSRKGGVAGGRADEEGLAFTKVAALFDLKRFR